MKILGIIPARYNSSRFPGKPLVNIHGKPMIQRVYEQCLKAEMLTKVVIATDDERIRNTCEKFGAEVIMTSKMHQSGTDRCAEVITRLNENYAAAINIQGDEPFIQPEQINSIAHCFANHNIDIATLIKKISNEKELFDEHIPKVTIDKNRFALYFSRSTIPFVKNTPKNRWINEHTFYKHLGIYGYRPDVLIELTKLDISPLEKAEGLEQLRWLENGYKIKTVETFTESISIDVPEDLEKLPPI